MSHGVASALSQSTSGTLPIPLTLRGQQVSNSFQSSLFSSLPSTSPSTPSNEDAQPLTAKEQARERARRRIVLQIIPRDATGKEKTEGKDTLIKPTTNSTSNSVPQLGSLEHTLRSWNRPTTPNIPSTPTTNIKGKGKSSTTENTNDPHSPDSIVVSLSGSSSTSSSSTSTSLSRASPQTVRLSMDTSAYKTIEEMNKSLRQQGVPDFALAATAIPFGANEVDFDHNFYTNPYKLSPRVKESLAHLHPSITNPDIERILKSSSPYAADDHIVQPEIDVFDALPPLEVIGAIVCKEAELVAEEIERDRRTVDNIAELDSKTRHLETPEEQERLRQVDRLTARKQGQVHPDDEAEIKAKYGGKAPTLSTPRLNKDGQTEVAVGGVPGRDLVTGVKKDIIQGVGASPLTGKGIVLDKNAKLVLDMITPQEPPARKPTLVPFPLNRPELAIYTQTQYMVTAVRAKVKAELETARKYPQFVRDFPEFTIPYLHNRRLKMLTPDKFALEPRRKPTTAELAAPNNVKGLVQRRGVRIWMFMAGFLLLSTTAMVLWDFHMEMYEGVEPPRWF